MKNILKLLIILVVLSITGQTELFAQSKTVSKAGISPAQFLRIHTGAKGTAMGGAVAADISDLSSMFWNPAGLADAKGIQILVEQGNLYAGLRHNFLAVSMPMGDGVLGVNVVSLDMGDFEETTFDYADGTGRTFKSYSYAVGLSYSAYLIPSFKIGANVKWINETINYSSANAVAFDIGTIYTTPFDGIRFGVSVTNIGLNKLQMMGDDLIVTTDLDNQGKGNYEPDARLSTDKFDAPMMLRVGLAYDAFKTDQFRATFTVDGTNPTDNVQSVSTGAELSFMKDLIQLRAGLPYLGLKDRVETFSAGLGVNYAVQSVKMQFGFSYQSWRYLNQISTISLGLQF